MKLLILFLLCFFVSLNLAQSDEPYLKWWKNTIIYEILPFSFKDSNGDGIGDIQGIISKLNYLDEMEIETLHMTPIYKTGMKDMGYDIYDYYRIDPRFGTMADFKELIYEMKKRNMKLILDLVINHSSDKHKWFRKSVQRIDPYTDFYTWKDPKGYDESGKPIPPNTWVSVFGGQPSSAWTWNSERKQYYFHQFLKEQPDFDLRNPRVKEELKKIIKFWLDKGVSGFRLDAAIFYIEDKEFRDDDHQIRQYNQEENYEFIHELRKFLDQYNNEHEGPERIFIAEAHSDHDIVRQFYDRPGYNITHFPYTFALRYINSEISSLELNNIIEPWLLLPSNAILCWMTQDHDGNRVGSRIRPEYMDILTTISMMLPGNVGVYYGQEIGMMDGPIEPHQIRDYSGGGTRDPARLPMQWDDSINGGFSSNRTTFLPPNPDYQYTNVKSQESQPTSHLQLFKDLSHLRTSKTFKYGDFQSYAPHKDVYLFTRSHNGRKIIVLSNLNNLRFRMDLKMIVKNSNMVHVAAASTNSEHKSGAYIGCKSSQNFILTPYSSVVIEAGYDYRYPHCYFDTNDDVWYTEEISSSSEYDDDD